MNITIRQLLDLVSGKLISRLSSAMICSLVFGLSACSTLYESESKSSTQRSYATLPAKQGSFEQTEAPGTANSKESSQAQVSSKIVPAAEETKSDENQAVVKKKTEIKQASKPANKKIVKSEPVKTRPEIVPAKPETKDPLIQVADPDLKKYQVNLAKLPLIIGENWVLDRGPDSSGQCALSYRQLVMRDGQGETPVSFIINKDSVIFRTKSNIDLVYEQTGLAIDDLPRIPIENLIDDFSISYKQHYLSLLNDMKSGDQAILSLGFWPTWPMTRAYSLSFDLSDFSSAQQALMDCLELEKQLK